MIATNLLLRLLFTHIVMDFLLQSDKMVSGRQSDKLSDRIVYNLKHSALHAIATYVVIMDWTNWIIPAVIFVSHFLIDFFYKKRKDGLQPFILDQTLHIAVIVALWIGISGQEAEMKDTWNAILQNNRIWLVLITYILMLKPTSTLIKKFIAKWRPQLDDTKQQISNSPKLINLKNATASNLEDAGQWIGYIERILVITFILMGCLEAIGFLLAAKSIFRYGDLKEAKDIKMTEYVLIGTLTSFLTAIVMGALLMSLIP